MLYTILSKPPLYFGSLQAANQFLDNYPPHLREHLTPQETSAIQCQTALTQIQSELSRCREGTQHFEWLLSRYEMFEKELPTAQSREAAINAKVAALPTIPEETHG